MATKRKRAKFNYQTYISAPPKKVKWFADDEFEVVVGTVKFHYEDMMDNAAQSIVKKIKFHLAKNGSVCKATTLKGDENLYLTDEQEMKLDIVMNNIDNFFENYEFTPQSFCSFLRYLMRPMSRTDYVMRREKNKSHKKNLIPPIQMLTDSITKILLVDRTTTKSFSINPKEVIPRYQKMQFVQKERTKTKAEVFTPISIVKKMNDSFDVDFKGSYLDYVKRTTLEVTCGEAPFITTRYDAVTGDDISVRNRVGLLDRKLQHIPCFVDRIEWCNLAEVSLKSTYGYEWQEDSTFIARKNVLLTTIEHYFDRFGESPNSNVIPKWAEIISYNIFRMDGLTMCVPETKIPVKVMDWENNKFDLFNND